MSQPSADIDAQAVSRVSRLQSGRFRAELWPAEGGRLARLQWRRSSGAWFDVLAPLAQGLQGPRWPKGGAYPLFPYSNRIRDARLAVQGREHALQPHPDALPHTLHGHAHLLPWACEATEASAVLQVTASVSAHWPWAFHATQAFALGEQGLVVDLAIRNLEARPMPAGLGWHPFFACEGPVALHHGAATLWPHDADYIPTGPAQAVRADWRSPVAFDGEARNAHLSGGSRACEIVHAGGVRVAMAVDAALDHLVVHYPASGAYLCVEPTSHVGDGFNLAYQGQPGTGARVLAAGETLAGRIVLQVDERVAR